MGTTKKTTDWLGRNVEEHYDDKGGKTGKTTFTTDWLGNPKQEHHDSDGNKTGETRRGYGLLGGGRAEHYDSQGKLRGYSKNEKDWLGRDAQRHYTPQSHRVGETRRDRDFFGTPIKRHDGVYFKSGDFPSGGCFPSNERGSYSHKSSSEGSGVSGLVAFVVGVPLVIGIMFGGVIGTTNSSTRQLKQISLTLEPVYQEEGGLNHSFVLTERVRSDFENQRRTTRGGDFQIPLSPLTGGQNKKINFESPHW